MCAWRKPEDVVDPSPTVEELLIAQEDGPEEDERELLQELVAALPPDLQEVVALRYFKGASQVETAGLLDLSERQVRRREQSALRRLRSTITEEV